MIVHNSDKNVHVYVHAYECNAVYLINKFLWTNLLNILKYVNFNYC